MATNLETITAILRGDGLTPAQVAGVEGNWTVESSLNPSAINRQEGALGLAQWEGGRLQALQAFARSKGKPANDLTTQVQFALSELHGSESGAYRALLAATTPAQAAAVFDQQYERSSGAARQTRIDDANKIAAGQDPSNGWTDKVNNAITSAPGAVAGAVGGAVSGIGSMFANWQTDLMGVGLKLAAAGIAGTLVVVGAKSALTDKGN